MKKFAYAMLSMLVVFGGLLLSACEKKVSLSVSVDEVTIYTNDANAEFYGKANVEVTLDNASGAYVEVVEGQDCVHADNRTTYSHGNVHFFTISADKSGQAKIKVSAIEDIKQSKEILVNVNTLTEELETNQAGTSQKNLFAVKGVQKQLDAFEYFNFKPITANMTDVVWTFEQTNSGTIEDNGKVVAKIENNNLWLAEESALKSVTLRASFALDKSVYNTVTLDVLENASFESLTIFNQPTEINGTEVYELKRNDAYRSALQGQLIVNSVYDINLTPQVYLKRNGKLEILENFSDYFIFDIIRVTKESGKIIYDFSVDAQDDSAKFVFGDFVLKFNVAYKAYNYDITPKDFQVNLQTAYAATGMEILNETGEIYNNAVLDVYSSYANGYGLYLKPIVNPTEVALDFDQFYLSIDVNTVEGAVNAADISSYLKVFYRGDELKFSADSGSVYKTPLLSSGSEIYVAASPNLDNMLSNVKLNFVPYSDGTKGTNIILNLYKIGSGKQLTVLEDGKAVEDKFVSSTAQSARQVTYNVRIEDVNLLSGLKLAHDDNDRFEFSALTQTDVGDDFIDVQFTISLNGTDFEDKTTFWFEHVTGKKSDSFTLAAFVPMNEASIKSGNLQSSNVYKAEMASQNYADAEGVIVQGELANESLSHLLMEAGSTLPLITTYQSLAQNGVVFKYLSIEDLIKAGATKEESENIFVYDDFVQLANYYGAFGDFPAGLVISENSIALPDAQFKGFVCASFTGYDLSHNQTSFVRFFALESLYSVTRLSADVKQKLLITQETLSQSELSRSFVDISVSLRADGKVPTYSNDLDMFGFMSAQDGAFAYNDAQGVYYNNHYQISDIGFTYGGRYLKFRVTAISTNFASSWQDTLTITFNDPNGGTKSTQVFLEIKNVERVQGVKWLSATENNEIYLNLTSTNASERQATISTAISPVDANDKSLTYAYFSLSGNAGSLDVQTNEIGQTFNLTIGNTTQGGAGFLYLLPNDMVKLVNGKSQVLIYRYKDGGHYADYIALDQLNEFYQQITTVKESYQNDEIVGYFFNNNNQKVNNADVIIKIRVTIADGLSEETAIRIYSADDLRRMDTAKYYQVVNNLEIANWKTISQFSGMLAGANQQITLNFAQGSQIFVANNKGTIKNLTFAGNVTSASTSVGFVAGVNNGTIEDVIVDVAKNGTNFAPSTIVANSTDGVFVGGIAGQNNKTILNSFVYGANIDATAAQGDVVVGGIAAKNSGSVIGCGVEFYTFAKTEDGSQTTYFNSFKTGSSAAIGAIVGYGVSGSVIENSYAYAYPLANGGNYKSVLNNQNNGNVGLFMAQNENNVKIVESFAFVGDLYAPTVAVDSAGNNVNIVNSYYTYRIGESFKTTVFDNAWVSYNGVGYTHDAGGKYEIDNTNAPKEGDQYSNIDASSPYKTLSSDLWELGSVDASGLWTKGDIDSAVNFGFLHLKNVAQSTEPNLASLTVKNVEGKAVAAAEDKAILFKYDVATGITSPADQSALQRKNTITYTELFGITQRQARSLVMTSQSTDISTDATSIQLNYASYSEISVLLQSKIDFTQKKTIKLLIINNLPTLSTFVNGQEVTSENTIAVQTGKTLDIVHNTSGTIYLNTNAYQTTNSGNVSVAFDSLDSDNLSKFTAVKNGTSIQLTGISATGENYGQIETYLTDMALSAADSNKLKAVQNRIFNVFVYDGANKLEIVNSDKLTFKTSEYAVIDVLLNTDNQADQLVFGLSYQGRDVAAEMKSGACNFKVDQDFTLNLSWTETWLNETTKTIHIVAQVDASTRQKVVQDYNGLVLSINAQSQQDSNKLEKSVILNVKAQDVETIGIATYSVTSRVYHASTLFFRPSNNLINTLSPASEAILAVSVVPAYSNITSFDLTYTSSPVGLGSVVISRLAYNSTFGYYLSSQNTTILDNGIKVDLTEEDKTGDGVYYFRIYATSQFSYNSSLKFNVNAYCGQTEVKNVSADMGINYMQQAEIKINGASTCLLSRGDTAKVTVTLGLNQRLYALYMRGAGANIDLSTYTEEVTSNTRIYTAYLTAYVNATTSNGNGEFYVYADVERVINGVQEIKSSSVTVNLVDFSLDAQNISLTNKSNKQTYNGVEYDVFTSYVGAKDTLAFDYPILPEEYNYNPADQNEVEAVEKLQAARRSFVLNKNYADDNLGYYINYDYSATSGKYEALSLKQQLSYVSNNDVSNPIYNDNYGTIRQNDNFGIEETGTGKNLVILGKKTGRQLMKLTTTVIYQNLTFKYEYYFLIVVDIWSDEETPTQITTAEEFVDFATTSAEADDYILMNDIVLDNYTPVSTDLIKSLDGNGYTIHLNSFAIPQEGELNLALFNVVNQQTTLKNVRVNVYGAGNIAVDITAHAVSNIAGFAIVNNGVLYNCEVVSYQDGSNSTAKNVSGINVSYTIGQNTRAENLTQNQISTYNVESRVAGFVVDNNASIVSCRVGGESFRYANIVAEENYIQTQALDVFTIAGQDRVAGFVIANNGNISASFAKNVDIYNNTSSTLSLTAGFALTNSKSIQSSYVEGKFIEGNGEDADDVCATGTHITSLGQIGGFIHTNSGLAKNSYSNIAIENSKSKPAYVGGFVYQNQAGGQIALCFSACDILVSDINQMPFCGVDPKTGSLNFGTITNSYFYSDTTYDLTNQTKLTTGVTVAGSNKLRNEPEDSLYGFSFASDDEAYDGIWKATKHGVTLVAANQIAFSNRYAVTTGNLTSIFYNRYMIEQNTYRNIDVSYGSVNNPFIVRNAYDFAVSTGKATNKEISYYKQYYSDTAVWGSYRVVNDIDMSEIDAEVSGETKVALTTYQKQFSGLLDGNGFTISNLTISSSNRNYQSFGLFSTLDGAVIMNANMVVGDINNAQAKVVGTLAGVAVDSRIIGISITPTVNTQNKTSVLGSNIIGGVVGMLFGKSVMVDVSASSMDIFSSYNGGAKDITANAAETRKLRALASSGGNLYEVVSKLSYAGAIAGYVDIYSDSGDYVKFATSLQVSDYDIINVHVQGNVSVYGEVVGGLFGYVGNGTYIYDATLKVDDPSYITAKNLYAGGLVGENYGGLFAVSTSYNGQNTQQDIETAEHAYYNGSLNVLRGQMDIFSHKTNQEDNPMYVGGLVGNMGGGYIYIGFSKLNVACTNSLAVGGLVGVATHTTTPYQLSLAKTAPTINILFNDVFAAGDLYTQNAVGVSGGLVGEINCTNGNTPIIAFKNALAMNYYSYQNQNNQISLIGDNKKATNEERNITSDNHFMVVGRYAASGKIDTLSTALYVINSTNDTYNLATNISSAEDIGSNTVGGYQEVQIGGNTHINLKAFGFAGIGKEEDVNKNILASKPMGGDAFATPQSAYIQNDSIFGKNGWSQIYWSHTKHDLYPHIQLVPRDDMTYWDADNTADVLKAIEENPNITIVVRGRVNHELDGEYQDIDLTNNNDFQNLYTGAENGIKNFGGTLISYHSYYETRGEGVVNTAGNSSAYGKNGDYVGLIINGSLFNSLATGARIEGLNIYMTPEPIQRKDENNKDIKDNIVYSVVNGIADRAIFRENNIVLTANVSLTATEQEGRAAAGIFVPAAKSTSFVDNVFTLKGAAEKIDLNASPIDLTTYMGVMVGYDQHLEKFTSMSVSGLDVVKMNGENRIDVDVNFNTFSGRTTYCGLYAGAVTKDGVSTRVSVGVSKIENLNININPASTSVDAAAVADQGADALYVGGFVGSVEGVTDVTLQSPMQTTRGSGIKILLHQSASAVYAGLAFGQIKSGNINISNEALNSIALNGAIYQGGTLKDKDPIVQYANFATAQIGGIAGHMEGGINVSSFMIDLTVAKLEVQPDETGANKFSAPKYTEGSGQNEVSIFASNKINYEQLSPFTTTGSGVDTAFGGLVGYSCGGEVSVSGSVSVNGTLDLATDLELKSNSTQTISAGGLIGKLSGVYKFAGTINNNLNTSVKGENETAANNGEANVGGMIGWINNNQNTANKDEIEISGGGNILGNTISNINTLNFGGAIGLLQMDDADISSISNVTYGGAVRIYGSSVENGTITAGGVVGSLSANNKSTDETGNYTNSKVSNCRTYGDVFVVYADSKTTNQNAEQTINDDFKFTSYNFGGIVGSATNTHIENCASIMTSFNSKYISTGDYKVGAIVGANHGENSYNGNTYSSGVCMAYQEEDGNTDCPYGANIDYYGYSSTISLTDDEKTNINSTNIITAQDVLSKFGSLVSDTTKDGHKLKPQTIEAGTVDASSNDVASYHNIKWYAYKGVNKTLTYDDNQQDEADKQATFIQNLSNAVFVGNSQTIKVVDKRTVEKDHIGAIANSLGENDSTMFNAITSLLVDLDVSADINADDGDAFAYGGVVGTTYGNAFIYGVGVQGELSVGGSNNALKLGGLVGDMQGGMINECYSASNITYRAAEGGKVAGITNLGQAKNAIKATYSSGLVQTYVNVPIYTFASVNTSASNTTNAASEEPPKINYTIDIVDSYSISVAKRNVQLITGENLQIASDEKKVFFINMQDSNVVQLPADKFYLRGEVFNGCEYTEDYKTNTSRAEQKNFSTDNLNFNKTKVMSAGYNESVNKVYSLQYQNPETKAGETVTTNTIWYFSPYTNHGYATHGFGYLKNVTTYTRSAKPNASITDTTPDAVKKALPTNEYGYTRVGYTDILKDCDKALQYTVGTEKNADANATNIWFMGVQNVGKFNQMVEATENTEKQTTTNKVYRFKLDQDINMQIYGNYGNYGKSVGRQYSTATNANESALTDETKITEFNKFILDGANHTLDFSFTKSTYSYDYAKDESGNSITTADAVASTTATGSAISNSIFGDVVGNIENLRVADINIDGTVRGTLAASVEGNLSNLTVTGNVETGFAPPNKDNNKSTIAAIGGVVGQVSGKVIGVEALVNVTSTKSGIIGGVVGQMESGKISYSSNAGQLIANGNDVNYQPDALRFTPVSPDGETANTAQQDKNTVDLVANTTVGGVVGYAKDVTVDNCYNANAVLSGYTSTEDEHNYFAGGIVGFADGATITNSVNVGLVGAGNYKIKEKYAYAGGIFAYGTNLGSVSNNVNDAKVEAITNVAVPETSKFDNMTFEDDTTIGIWPDKEDPDKKHYWSSGDEIHGNKVYGYGKSYTLTNFKIHLSSAYYYNSYDQPKKHYGAWEDTTGYLERNNTTIHYDVTFIYNLNQNRRVNAYGIGFVGNNYVYENETQKYSAQDQSSSQVDSNNYTSQDNIVNDGCIGQVSETQTLTFDRQAILDNDKGAIEAIKGMFTMQDGLTASGFDSYGFLSRIYKEDKISRIYADKVETDDNREIIKLENDLVTHFVTSVGGTAYSTRQTQPYYMGQFEWNDSSKVWDQQKSGTGGRFFYDFKVATMKSAVFQEKYKEYLSLPFFSGDGLAERDLNNMMQSGKDTDGYLYNFLKNGELKGIFALEDLAMKQDTNYYASAAFSGYDVILRGGVFDDQYEMLGAVKDTIKKGNRGFGLVAYDLNVAENKSLEVDDSDEEEAANKQIVNIDAALEVADNLQTTTIQGQLTAVAYNKNDVLSVVAPYAYPVKVDINKASAYTNAKITSVKYGDKELYFKENTRSEDGKQITLTVYSNTQWANPQFTIVYKSDYTNTVQLVGTNVEGCYIILDNGWTEADINHFNEVANKSETELLDQDQRIKSVFVGGEEIWDFTLGFGSEENEKLKDKAWIKLADKDKDKIVNGKEVRFVVEEYRQTAIKVDLSSTDSTFAEFTVGQFDDFDKDKLPKFFYGNYTEQAHGLTFSDGMAGKEATLPATSGIAFGYVNEAYEGVHATFDGSTWSVNGNDKVTLNIKDGKLVVSGSDANAFVDGLKMYQLSDNIQKLKDSGTQPLKGLYAKEIETKDGIKVSVLYGYGTEGFTVGGVKFGISYGTSTVLGTVTDFNNLSSSLDSEGRLVVKDFGIFKQVTVMYKPNIPDSVVVESGNAFGFTYKNGKSIIQGAASEAKNEKYSTEFKNIAIGDTINLSVVTSSVDGESFENISGWGDESSVVLRNSGNSYFVINSTEINMEDDDSINNTFKELLNEKHYIETLIEKDKYHISYKIYENGVVSVAYTFFNETEVEGADFTTLQEDVGAARMFVYNPIEKVIYQVLKKAEEYTEEQDDGSLKTYIEYLWDYSKAESYIGSDDVLNRYNGVKVDLIATKILKDKVLFAKNEVGEFNVDAISQRGWKEVESANAGVEIVKHDDLKSTFNPDEEIVDAEYVKNTLTYSVKDENNWKHGDTIVNDTLDVIEYEYKAKINTSTIATGGNPESKATVDFANMLFAEDIHLDGAYSDNNNVSVLGNDKVVKFLSAGNSGSISMFTTFNGNISNLNIVGICSLRDIEQNKDYVMLTTPMKPAQSNQNRSEERKLISNITLYGTIRNIGSANSKVSVVPDGVANMLNTNSYVSVVGLDETTSKSGISVSTVINDAIKISEDKSDAKYQEASAYTSFNILIAANGANGANGEDGAVKAKNGKNGSDGGNGGQINITNSFNGKARSGVAGIGGYGGNGRNGYFSTAIINARNGGFAGTFGVTGLNGKVTNLSETKNSNVLSIRPNIDNIPVYSGNGGIGAFGRIASSGFREIDYYYYRGFSSTEYSKDSLDLQVLNRNGSKKGYLKQATNNGNITNYGFGAVSQMDFAQNQDSVYPGAKGKYDNDKANEWKTNVAGTTGSWGVNKGNDGDSWGAWANYGVQKLNVLIKIAMTGNKPDKLERGNKLVWSDGRDLNYGGEFARATDKKDVKLAVNGKTVAGASVRYNVSDFDYADQNVWDSVIAMNDYYILSDAGSEFRKQLEYSKLIDVVYEKTTRQQVSLGS